MVNHCQYRITFWVLATHALLIQISTALEQLCQTVARTPLLSAYTGVSFAAMTVPGFRLFLITKNINSGSSKDNRSSDNRHTDSK